MTNVKLPCRNTARWESEVLWGNLNHRRTVINLDHRNFFFLAVKIMILGLMQATITSTWINWRNNVDMLCATSFFLSPHCWPRTWTIPPKNHHKTTLDERKTGIRAVWPKLSVTDCIEVEWLECALKTLWKQSEFASGKSFLKANLLHCQNKRSCIAKGTF